MIFYSEFLILDDSTAISLRAIESMRFPGDADATAEKLKDDPSIEVVMWFGNKYILSIRRQFKDDDWGLLEEGAYQARLAIFEKWKKIVTGKS